MATVTTWIEPTGPLTVLRSATAQADTGQTDWIKVPKWATYAYFDVNVTAMAGSTPSVSGFGPRIYAMTVRDDTNVVAQNQALVAQGPSAALTAAARVLCIVGPGVTGIANDATNSGTGTSQLVWNAVLPAVIGWRMTFDRADGNETYTYTVTVSFR